MRGDAAFVFFFVVADYVLLSEGGELVGLITHQDEAGVVGHLTPFVEIESGRVGAFDPLQSRREFLRESPNAPKHHRRETESPFSRQTRPTS